MVPYIHRLKNGGLASVRSVGQCGKTNTVNQNRSFFPTGPKIYFMTTLKQKLKPVFTPSLPEDILTGRKSVCDELAAAYTSGTKVNWFRVMRI